MKGVELYCARIGEGEPLMILHGLLGLSDNWMTLAKRFAEHFQVLLPDLRNHGRSPHSPVFNYQSMVDDLVDLIKSYNIKSLYVLGHSMGGRVAMMLAVQYPELVQKCVVVDMSPFSLPQDNTHIEILNAMNRIDITKASTFQQVEQLIRVVLLDDRIVQMCLKNVKRAPEGGFSWKPDVAVLLDQIDNLRQPIPNDSLFLRPVLFIKGERSPYIRNEEWNDIQKLFPASQLILVENAGHWVHADAPDVFYSIVSGFFAEK